MSNDIYISVVLDESGSMQSVARPTVDGYNKFIGDQKEFKDGNAVVSLTRFNTQSRVNYSGIPIASVPPLTLGDINRYVNTSENRYAYYPSGGTALNDAVVDAIRATENELLKDEGTPKVMIVIITDGGENSSVRFPEYKHVAKLIDQKTQQGWIFVFLGADQDAWANANNYGAAVAANSVSYASARTHDMYRGLSNATTQFRSNNIEGVAVASAVADWLEEEEQK